MKYLIYIFPFFLTMTFSLEMAAAVAKEEIITILKERVDEYKRTFPQRLAGGNDDPTVSTIRHTCKKCIKLGCPI